MRYTLGIELLLPALWDLQRLLELFHLLHGGNRRPDDNNEGASWICNGVKSVIFDDI